MTATAPAPVSASDITTPALREARGAAAIWAAFLPRLLARIALFAGASLLFFAVVPALIGWHVTTVMSDSMAPRFVQGDLIVSLPMSGDRVVPGEVALFKDPDHPGRLRLHRVIKVSATHVLTTKGDANAEPDSTPVQPDTVLGVGILRVPYVGYPIFWIRTGRLVPLGVFGGAFAGALVLAMPAVASRERENTDGPAAGGGARRGEREPKVRRREHRQHRQRRPPREHRRGLRHGVTVGLVAVAVSAVLAATVATPAHSSFSSASAPPASKLSAASSFSCLAAAPQNAAYFYYRFGETSGTSAADSSGNGHTGTLHGGVTHVAGSCAAGGAPAITLDGSTGFLSTPTSLSAPNTFTLSVWFKTTTTSGGKLIGFGNSQSGASTVYDRQLYLGSDGRVNFGVYPGSYTYDVVTSSKSYNDGTWHRATATLSSAGMHLYVDGAQVAQNTGVTSGESFTGYWRVGYDSLSSSWPNAPKSPYFAGSLSDVAVYTTALTATQVASTSAAGR